jgi:hypothetical protein
MKTELTQINKDCDILHDFVNDFYEANFSENGKSVTVGSYNAIIVLHKMNDYIKDLIKSYIEQNEQG